jgi:phosphotransferase system enzyme I (PtsP)
VGQVRLRFGEGLVGHAAQRAESVAVVDALGVLVVQTREPREFQPRDVELLDTCARLIAPLVMNAQLFALMSGPEEVRASIVSQLGSAGLGVGAAKGPARAERNVEVRGIPASRGIAIGPVHFLDDPVDLESIDYVPNPDPKQERRDLLDALADARRELHDVRDEVGERFGPDFAAVFNTHIQILEDKGFVAKLEESVGRTGSGLQAIRVVLAAYQETFARIENPFFRERGIDVVDVGQRVMAKLLGVRIHNIPLTDGAIVVASHLLPAHFALLETEKIAAVASEHGGPTSHGAIFARALEIPSVTGASGILDAARPGEQAIVDGYTGLIYLSPDEQLRREYERAKHRDLIAVEHLDALADRPAETRDGTRVVLTANVGLLSDLRLCERHGAEGIGLFRTELIALAHRGFPSEDEQEQLYEGVAEAMAPRPVTIRTLDLGGDKVIPDLAVSQEQNPQLGWRSIRISLSDQESFRAQLRAILRASAQRNVRLLIPMISAVGELLEVRALVEETKEELTRRGVCFDPDLPIGVMIEIPSAALISEPLARECDFFSIGTNDLTQYTLAVDRGNEKVAHLYSPFHPAVLTLIDRAVRGATRAGIPVSVCGEMANNPLAVPLLVGLGIGELSGVASAVPVVKEIVRSLEMGKVTDDARRALEAGSVAEVEAIAAERLRSSGLLDHPDIGSWLERAIERALGS